MLFTVLHCEPDTQSLFKVSSLQKEVADQVHIIAYVHIILLNPCPLTFTGTAATSSLNVDTLSRKHLICDCSRHFCFAMFFSKAIIESCKNIMCFVSQEYKALSIQFYTWNQRSNSLQISNCHKACKMK